MNFVLKLRSFWKKWNSYLLEQSQVKTCFVWALTQTNSKVFCAAKQSSSIFAGKLVKISAQGHNCNPPEMAILLSNPHKISAQAAAKQQNYHMKTLFHHLMSERTSGIFISTRKDRWQVFFYKKQLISYINIYHLFAERIISNCFLSSKTAAGVFIFEGDIWHFHMRRWWNLA